MSSAIVNGMILMAVIPGKNVEFFDTTLRMRGMRLNGFIIAREKKSVE